ncbi:hypothetical protein [Paraconexibacter sp. AEG42_29]
MTTSRRLPTAALAATALAALALPAGAASAPLKSGKVVRVADGDTLTVRSGGRTETVDLVGVKAPARASCFADRSTRILRALLPAGTSVRLADEQRVAGRGRYVLKSGTFINAAILRAGAGRVTGTTRFARGSALRTAAAAARGAGRGIFGDCPQAAASPGTGGAAGGTKPAQPGAVPAGPTPAPPTPAGDDRPVTDATRMKAALDGLALVTFRSDANSSERQDTLFCADGRVERTEEFSAFASGGGNVRNDFAGSWVVGHTQRQTDGSLAAEVLVRADDATLDFRRLLLVLGTDGKVRQNGRTTDSARSTRPCAAAPAGAAVQNDTATGRQRFLQAITGRRFDAGGIGSLEACSNTRGRRTEDGIVTADGALTVEWAISDGTTHAGIVRIEDSTRGSARRMQVVLPAGGTPQLQELGRGDGAARTASSAPTTC